MNKVTMIGRLTADPQQFANEIGELQFVRFSIAVGRRRSAGQTVDFFDVTAFSGLANVIAMYCKKGEKISVSGRLEQSYYTTKDGIRKCSVGIVAEDVEFLGTKKEPASEEPEDVEFLSAKKDPASEEPHDRPSIKVEPEKKTKYYPKR